MLRVTPDLQYAGGRKAERTLLPMRPQRRLFVPIRFLLTEPILMRFFYSLHALFFPVSNMAKPLCGKYDRKGAKNKNTSFRANI